MNYLKKYIVMLAVGWYLMVPLNDWDSNGNVVTIPGQSISQYDIWKPYDTAKECWKELLKQWKHAPANRLDLRDRVCIASDDPRLVK